MAYALTRCMVSRAGLKFLENIDVMGAFSRFSKLVKFTKQSAPCQRGLFHCQEKHGLRVRLLPSPVITRFVSQAECWRAMLTNKPAVNDLFTEPPALDGDGKPCISRTQCSTHKPPEIEWSVITNALNVVDQAISLVVRSQVLTIPFVRQTCQMCACWCMMVCELDDDFVLRRRSATSCRR